MVAIDGKRLSEAFGPEQCLESCSSREVAANANKHTRTQHNRRDNSDTRCNTAQRCNMVLPRGRDQQRREPAPGYPGAHEAGWRRRAQAHRPLFGTIPPQVLLTLLTHPQTDDDGGARMSSSGSGGSGSGKKAKKQTHKQQPPERRGPDWTSAFPVRCRSLPSSPWHPVAAAVGAVGPGGVVSVRHWSGRVCSRCVRRIGPCRAIGRRLRLSLGSASVRRSTVQQDRRPPRHTQRARAADRVRRGLPVRRHRPWPVALRA